MLYIQSKITPSYIIMMPLFWTPRSECHCNWRRDQNHEIKKSQCQETEIVSLNRCWTIGTCIKLLRIKKKLFICANVVFFVFADIMCEKASICVNKRFFYYVAIRLINPFGTTGGIRHITYADSIALDQHVLPRILTWVLYSPLKPYYTDKQIM